MNDQSDALIAGYLYFGVCPEPATKLQHNSLPEPCMYVSTLLPISFVTLCSDVAESRGCERTLSSVTRWSSFTAGMLSGTEDRIGPYDFWGFLCYFSMLSVGGDASNGS